MHFDLSDEQKQLQRSVDGWLADAADRSPGAVWQEAAELGLTAITVPEQYGGLGLDLLTLAVVIERCGFHAATAPVMEQALVALAIARGGTEAQRQRWLPALAAGTTIATLAFAEAGNEARWQPAAWQLNGPLLGGTKRHVVAADRAGLILVGLAGGRLALVESNAGITTTALDSIDPSRPTFDLVFDQTESELLAEDIAETVRDAALVCLAADAHGAAHRAQTMAIEYVKTRHQFGRPIGAFQGLKYQIVDAAIQLEPSRYLYWYAAHAFDAMPAEAAKFAALAKSHVTDVAVTVARTAVEAHGGIGFTWEYPLHHFLKRAMFDRAWLGLPASHRQRTAGMADW